MNEAALPPLQRARTWTDAATALAMHLTRVTRTKATHPAELPVDAYRTVQLFVRRAMQATDTTATAHDRAILALVHTMLERERGGRVDHHATIAQLRTFSAALQVLVEDGVQLSSAQYAAAEALRTFLGQLARDGGAETPATNATLSSQPLVMFR